MKFISCPENRFLKIIGHYKGAFSLNIVLKTFWAILNKYVSHFWSHFKIKRSFVTSEWRHHVTLSFDSTRARLHLKSKVDQSSFLERFESGSNLTLNTWSENSPEICYASKVVQSSYHVHIKQVIISPSHILLDQSLYPRVYSLNELTVAG